MGSRFLRSACPPVRVHALGWPQVASWYLQVRPARCVRVAFRPLPVPWGSVRSRLPRISHLPSVSCCAPCSRDPNRHGLFVSRTAGPVRCAFPPRRLATIQGLIPQPRLLSLCTPLCATPRGSRSRTTPLSHALLTLAYRPRPVLSCYLAP